MREFTRLLQHDVTADRSGDLRRAEVPVLSSKRCFDLAAASVGLLVTAPVSVVAAVATRMSSPGPVLFVQTRIGLEGREIKVHKFRTMRVGPPGTMITQGRDPRITGIGAILRRTKVDELPQLWDVLRGNMSVVGPRPEVREYVDQWPAELRPVILSVRPGITDPATILLRNEQELLAAQPDPERFYVDELLPQKAQMYADYVRQRSLRGDVKLIVATLRAIVRS